MATPQHPVTSNGTPPTQLKKPSLLNTILNFGKPTYAPLTPIEILPGIMSNDGVAKVFQLDTRKPRTVKQAAKRAAVVKQQRNGQWEDALHSHDGQKDGYFDSARMSSHSGSASTFTGRSSPKKSFIRALVDDGIDDSVYEKMLHAEHSKNFKKKNKIKQKDLNQNGAPGHQLKGREKGAVSPTDKLVVRHANPFTGVLSRNQTELNLSKYAEGGGYGKHKSNSRPSSPLYPHYKQPTMSTPNLSPLEAFEDLVPMPSVHEPAPFSFPGATADEIDAYERALEAAAYNVANNMAVPPSRIHSNSRQQTENVSGGLKSQPPSFLAQDGGLREQQGQRRTHKTKRLISRTDRLQDRHQETSSLPLQQKINTVPLPYPLLTPRLSPIQYHTGQLSFTPKISPTHSVSSSPEQAQKLRQRPTSTSTSTMRKGGGTPTRLSRENRAQASPPLRMEKQKQPGHHGGNTANVAAVDGAGTRTTARGKDATASAPGLRFPPTKKSSALAFFEKMPFVDPRQLADYRRARAGLPPLNAKEGFSKSQWYYSVSNSTETETVSSSDGEMEYTKDDVDKIYQQVRRTRSTEYPVKTTEKVPIAAPESEKSATEREREASTTPSSAIDPIISFITSFFAPPTYTLPPILAMTIPLPVQQALRALAAFMNPVFTLNVPPGFKKLPWVIQVVLGVWYVVFVTWAMFITARLVGIVGEVVGLIMVPVRGVVWIGRVMLGG